MILSKGKTIFYYQEKYVCKDIVCGFKYIYGWRRLRTYCKLCKTVRQVIDFIENIAVGRGEICIYGDKDIFFLN